MNEYDLISMYNQMERELIASMRRNLKRHQKEEEKVGFKFSQWQADKLKSLRKYRKENKHIIEAYTKGLNKEVTAMLSEQLKEGKLDAFSEYKKALKNGYETNVNISETDSFFKTNSRKANTMIKVINNDLKKANNACLRRSNDIYREVIHKASTFVSNGVYTERQAVDMAIKEFAGKGVNCIVYKNGARHTISDYASMAIRTANQRAQLMAEGEFRKKIGETLVIISKHGTACKICQQFENKVFIDDVYSGGTAEDGNYPLLSDAMKQGMFHPNCRHGLNTYYEELEETTMQKEFIPTKTKAEAEERMKNTLGSYSVNLGRMNNKLANEYLDGVETFVNEYPQVKGYVEFVNTRVGSDNGVFSSGDIYYTRQNKTAISQSGRIGLRSPRDLARFRAVNERDAKSGWFYENHSPKGTAVHELTHALEHLMYMKKNGYIPITEKRLSVVQTVFGEKFDRGEIAAEIIEQARMELFGAYTGEKVEEGIKFLGKYAMTNYKEQLAQAIAFELTAGTNPYSAKIKEIFDKMVKELLK